MFLILNFTPYLKKIYTITSSCNPCFRLVSKKRCYYILYYYYYYY